MNAPFPKLVTGASVLGAVMDFAEFFSVRGAAKGTKFDVFPGAPSITDRRYLAFKGNYSEVDPESGELVGKTGVFFRRVKQADVGGDPCIELIANSDMEIPDPQGCEPGTTFGSTAPPSATRYHMVFVGLDKEDDPSCGGIYRARTETGAELEALVALGDPVPGIPDAVLNRVGEGLSFEGDFLSFWGAWGDESKIVRLYCPEDGNQARRDYGNNTGAFSGGRGDSDSICTDGLPCYQEKEVPIHRGIFVS